MYMSSVHHVFPWVCQHSWANLVSIIVRSMNSVVRRPTRKNVLTRLFGKKVSSSLRRMKCKHPSKCFILISWVLNPLYSPTVWWQVQAWGPYRTLSFLGLKEAVLCHLFPVEKERSGWISHLDLSPLGDAHEVWDHYDGYWLRIWVTAHLPLP